MEKQKILIFISNFLLIVSGIFIYLGITNLQKGYSGCDQNLNCYLNFYSNFVEKKGVAQTFEILKKDYSKNSYVLKQCHSITHTIGHSAYKLYPDVTEAFDQGDPFCWSGYYHGVMEELTEEMGKNGLGSKINSICSNIQGKENHSFNYYNCVHGLGHGVLTVSNYELFDALKVCDLLTGEYERQNCYGGVYMENVVQDGTFQNIKYLKKDDLLYPCTAVTDKYKKPCYLMQPTYILISNHNNFQNAFDLCRNADQGMLSYCLDGVGREAMGQVENANYKKVIAICNLGNSDEEKSYCYSGAVKNIVAYFHSDKQANDFCTVVPENIRQSCLSTVKDYYRSF